MFDINNIYTNNSNSRLLCDHICDSAERATFLAASFLGPIREYCFTADLYSKGSILVLDAPNYKTIKVLIPLLNDAISHSH